MKKNKLHVSQGKSKSVTKMELQKMLNFPLAFLVNPDLCEINDVLVCTNQNQ